MKRFDKLIRGFCKFITKIIKKNHDEDTINSLAQFVKFGIVGISNTLLSYVINVTILLIMKPLDVSWDYFVGNIVSFILSVLWSFYWNNKYVFTIDDGESRSIGKTLLKTYVSYGFTGIVLNNVLSWLWVSVLGISKYIAPIINLLASVPINFFINKLWAFRVK